MILHARHSGSSRMNKKAEMIVIWPEMAQKIADMRARCKECIDQVPSQLAMPPHNPVVPDFLLSSLWVDFHQMGKSNFIIFSPLKRFWAYCFKARTPVYHTGNSYILAWIFKIGDFLISFVIFENPYMKRDFWQSLRQSGNFKLFKKLDIVLLIFADINSIFIG